MSAYLRRSSMLLLSRVPRGCVLLLLVVAVSASLMFVLVQPTSEQPRWSSSNNNKTQIQSLLGQRGLFDKGALSRLLDGWGGIPHRLIDLGAGVRDDDPCFDLVDQGWSALLVDGDPQQQPKMEARFPHKRATKLITFIESSTVEQVLRQHNFLDNDIGLFKIDIDSFDCDVVHAVLKVLRPRVIIMEVNVKFPPHVRFALLPGNTSQFDSEQRGHIYGCSLAFQVHEVMRPQDYELAYMDWNNALYVDTHHFQLPQQQRHSLDDWYDHAYWGRSERDTTFAFNVPTVAWHHLTAPEIVQHGVFQSSLQKEHRNHMVAIGDKRSSLLMTTTESAPQQDPATGTGPVHFTQVQDFRSVWPSSGQMATTIVS